MKNIVLTGLMGAGKSTVGKLLATNLNFEFVDTDEYIEHHENIKITEIFNRYGEEYFRNLENNVILNLSQKKSLVISTGGGSVQNIENLNNLKKNGFVVYLKATPENLFERIKNDKSRPLLQNANPLGTLKNLLAKRETNYNQANLILRTDDKDVNDIIKLIIKEYNENVKC